VFKFLNKGFLKNCVPFLKLFLLISDFHGFLAKALKSNEVFVPLLWLVISPDFFPKQNCVIRADFGFRIKLISMTSGP